MPSQKITRIPKTLRPSLAAQKIRLYCNSCWYLNAVSVQRLYDGYEGEFACERCGAPLEQVHEAIEEE